MSWSDDRVEALKTLWAEGLSASQIAARIGGVTRNAVIGKVHRLGLSGRAAPAKPQRGCAGPAAAAEAPAAPEKDDFDPALSDADFIAPATLASGQPVTVATLARNMCKWPVGDPATDEFHFCGQPTPAGKPYCAYHARLAFQPPRARTEAPARPRRPTPAAIVQRAAG